MLFSDCLQTPKLTFFLDFEGSDKDATVAGVLKQMEGLTKWVKYLGSYPVDKTA